MNDQIYSYREMCERENVQTLQRGMNFRLSPSYSVILMSQRNNAPYQDRIYSDGLTIEYEGHDVSKKDYGHNPKEEDQPEKSPTGRLTQNGLFAKSVEEFKSGSAGPELVKVYEKILPGTWSFKGYFDLIDYRKIFDGKRNVFRFVLKISGRKKDSNLDDYKIGHSRLIPSEVKKEVWKRDGGKCVLCGNNKNLHFDHDLPFAKGGTSLTTNNIRILCARCNLAKSDKIE